MFMMRFDMRAPEFGGSTTDLYTAAIDMAEWAETRGCMAAVISEHHTSSDGYIPSPLLLASAMAARTDQLHISIAAALLAFYDPIRLAEDMAVLDIISNGRLSYTLGLGYRPEEFDYLGVPYKERAGRFDESLELMTRLWTEDTVTFHGKYWTLEDVHPHLFPVQQPHPPIWIGAHAIPGVRRAAKYGDAYACPPETPKDEVARRYAIVRDGFEARGKTFGPQPLRRNCLVADTREEAMVEYARVAQGRYLTYAAKGLDVMKDTDLENEFAKAVAGHAVIGTPDEVVAQLVDYVTALPVDPLLLRPQWPTMTADETIATLDRLGRDVVPAITAITPRRDIDEALLAPVAT